jgi:hypothetical protein
MAGGQCIVARHLPSGEKRNFASQGQAAKALDLPQTNILQCLKGKLQRVGEYAFEIDGTYKDDQADLPGEIWTEIPEAVALSSGYTPGMMAGKFSSAGRVQDKRKRRSYGADEKAVKMVKVSEGTSSKKARVHILCALAFHGPQPSNEHLVKHLNKDNNDNQSNNLAWVHRTESSAGIGTVKRVQKFEKDTGILLATYESIMEAAELNNIAHRSQISDVIAGRKITAGGFKWKLVA